MNVLLWLYRFAAHAMVLLASPYLLWRAAAHPAEMKERLAIELPSARRPLWLHAASLGEVEAVRNLLLERPAEVAGPLLVTVTSVSARRRAGERLGPEVEVRFLPLDLDGLLSRFLARVRPRALLLVETELWPVLLAICARHRVPCGLVSGRISDRNWVRLRGLRWALRALLPSSMKIAAQAEDDARRFRALGFREVEVVGNLKYRMEGAERPRAPRETRESRLTVTIGSLRKGEEAVLAALAELPSDGRPRIVLAPRHLREGSYWERRARAAGFEVVRRSRAAPLEPGDSPEKDRERLQALLDDPHRVLLLDQHGELRRWYAASDCAIVGGTFVPIGGHSLFEPAALGVPVLFGPHDANVRDVAGALLASGGGVRVRDASGLSGPILEWSRDARALASASAAAELASRRLAGAAERTWQRLLAPDWPLSAEAMTRSTAASTTAHARRASPRS